MGLMKRALLGLAVLALASGIAAGALAVYKEAEEDVFISAIRHGGYVLYLRHAQRYKGPPDNLFPDSPPAAFADCTHQRNLTPYGVDQAALLGEYFRRLDIKLDRVIANPSCRTRGTAMLAFGRATLEPRMMMPTFVRDQLGVAPAPGTNSVLVGGENPLRQIVGFEIEPAEIAIFKPDGKGGATLVGRLKLDDWIDGWFDR